MVFWVVSMQFGVIFGRFGVVWGVSTDRADSKVSQTVVPYRQKCRLAHCSL